MKIFLQLLVIGCLLNTSCGVPSRPPETASNVAPRLDFLNHFTYLQGQKFYGKQVFLEDGRESWADLELEMYVKDCLDSTVRIPFRVGNNTSRTWILNLEEDGRLHLMHSHLHEDGKPEGIHLYGGYGTDANDEFTRVFPADEYTCKMLERACANEWTMKFSPDLSVFSYILKKKGALVIQLDFDLTQAH